jgi:glucose/arabinose dehydrogenase
MTRALAVALLLAACNDNRDETGFEQTDISPDASIADAIPDSNSEDSADTRPAPSITCNVGQSSRVAPTLALVDAFPGLTFDMPMALVASKGRIFIAERAGRIILVEGPRKSEVLDFSAQVYPGFECGFLGLALHPDFAENGRLFVNYCTRREGQTYSIISEWRMLENRIDPASERLVLELRQPWDNHNGGVLAFGPDGHLYAGFGDGGSGNDPLNSGQDMDSLLGKILRLDVDGAAPYAIPPDNPFGNGGGRPEIYASGFRNPWRMSFDRETGVLWVADVGQNAREEVNRVERGKNYGWRVMEGSICRPGGGPCEPSKFEGPVLEYTHDVGRSITGGYVYRGTRIPSLRGFYLYADYATRLLFAWDPSTPPPSIDRPTPLLTTTHGIVSFGEDEAGELHLLDLVSGRISTLVSQPGLPSVPPPSKLSETGCFDNLKTLTPSAGLLPYTPLLPFWSDGADKTRYLLLPRGGVIEPQPPSEGAWRFPIGTLFIKHFDFQANAGLRRLETRFLIQEDKGVRGFTYRWNEDGTDATLDSGTSLPIEGSPVTWQFPTTTQCTTCHRGDGVLGLDGYQIAPDTFAEQLSKSPEFSPHASSDAPIEARARSWLHVNCAYCHEGLGPSGTALDLRRHIPLAATEACDVLPQRGDLGQPDARIIAPGDPNRSILWQRINRRDTHAMPPLGTSIVDPDADLVRQWIDALVDCAP